MKKTCWLAGVFPLIGPQKWKPITKSNGCDGEGGGGLLKQIKTNILCETLSNLSDFRRTRHFHGLNRRESEANLDLLLSSGKLFQLVMGAGSVWPLPMPVTPPTPPPTCVPLLWEWRPIVQNPTETQRKEIEKKKKDKKLELNHFCFVFLKQQQYNTQTHKMVNTLRQTFRSRTSRCFSLSNITI